MIITRVLNGRVMAEAEVFAGESVEATQRILPEPNEFTQILSTSVTVESRFRIPTTKFLISRLRARVKEDPRIMVELDFLQFLPTIGFREHEIKEIKSEVDKCLDEMAREKTGFDLDEESKTLLRNELIFASLVLASG